MPPYGVGVRFWRPDLDRFDLRSPGLVRYQPADERAAHGEALTTQHVGPRAGVVQRTYTGPKTTNLDNTSWFDTYNYGSRIVYGVHFDACSFTANALDIGTLFVDCTFTGMSPSSSTFTGEGSGLEFLHCDFDVRGQTPRALLFRALQVRTLTARNCRFRGYDSPVKVGVNALFDRCLISDIMPFDPVVDQHQSGMSAQQTWNITGSTVRRCKVLAAHAEDPANNAGISSAFSHYNDGTHTGLTVEDTYFATSSFYCLYGGAATSKADPFSTNLVIRNNVFGRDFSRYSGASYPAYGFNSADVNNVWEGNRYGPFGPYNVPGDAPEGTVITAPTPDGTSNR